MQLSRKTVAGIAVVAVGIGVAFAVVAQPGGMTHAGPMGMHGMGMHRGMQQDAAAAEDMGLVHELLADPEQIRRSVTRLPDGIRTVTDSDNPQVTQAIQAHVASMSARLADGREFNMFSSPVPVLFENASKDRHSGREHRKGGDRHADVDRPCSRRRPPGACGRSQRPGP
jgi:hypothetical protein